MPNYNFNVTIEGIEGLMSKLQNSPRIVEDAERSMLERATLQAKTTAKENAPVDKSILRGSIDHDIKGSVGEMVGIVGTNVKYAKFQEEGTGIYGKRHRMITPINARMLAFKAGGKMVFARAVRGTEGKFYLKKGLEDVKSSLDVIRKIGFDVLRKGLSL